MSPRHPPEPRSYVVRVYRRGPEALAGSVEDVRTGRSRAFASAAELWRAIGGPAAPAPHVPPPSTPDPESTP